MTHVTGGLDSWREGKTVPHKGLVITNFLRIIDCVYPLLTTYVPGALLVLYIPDPYLLSLDPKQPSEITTAIMLIASTKIVRLREVK